MIFLKNYVDDQITMVIIIILDLVKHLKDIEMWKVDYVNDCYVFDLPRGSSMIDVESAFKEAMDICVIPPNVTITKEELSGIPMTIGKRTTPLVMDYSLGHITVKY